MKHSCLILLASLLICFGTKSQNNVDKTFEKEFAMSVKGMSEFMARFNGDEVHPMLTNKVTNLRIKELASLCEYHIILLDNKDNILKFNEFADSIINNNVKLAYTDTTWFAEAYCKVKFKGAENHITLFLRTERREGNMFKWVLVAAKGDLLGLNKPQKPLTISPTSNELYFMDISGLFQNNAKNASAYAFRSYRPDGLSAFFSLVHAGVLRIDYVEKLTYHLLQVPGYVFHVNRYDRGGNNSGWLISSFTKCSDNFKCSYIHKLFDIY
jgi:hypothetical protein